MSAPTNTSTANTSTANTKTAAPLPYREQDRVLALRHSGLLDGRSNQEYDNLTREAARQLQCPMALLSFLDYSRQLPKSQVGLEFGETPRESAICAYTILCQPTDAFVVHDARQDHRFCHSPLVKEEPRIRFYAGVPVVSPDGYAIGSLCVMDHEPRMRFDAHELSTLVQLASDVSRLIEAEPAPDSSQVVNIADRRVGLRIRQAREQMRVTRRELAGRTGISIAQLENYESGQQRAPTMILLSLAIELRLRLSHFVQDL